MPKNDRSRQPKGQSDGGQFAPDVHRESNVLLVDDPTREVITREIAIERIKRELGRIDRLEPNDEGVRLINDSVYKLEGEVEVHGGIAWSATLDVDGKRYKVSNDGNGGSNRYSAVDGDWRDVDALEARVRAGFPGLDDEDSEPLDDFCLVAEVARLN